MRIWYKIEARSVQPGVASRPGPWVGAAKFRGIFAAFDAAALAER